MEGLVVVLQPMADLSLPIRMQLGGASHALRGALGTMANLPGSVGELRHPGEGKPAMGSASDFLATAP